MPASGGTHPEAGNQRIALPLDGDRLSTHFGHASKFIIYSVSDSKIVGEEAVVPPPHAPGVIPAWLAEQGEKVGALQVLLFRPQGLFGEKIIERV